MATLEEDLSFLIKTLQDERSASTDPLAATAIPNDFGDAWELFRALANTRLPLPLSAEFLSKQDRLLHAIIAEEGVTYAELIPPCAGDERLSIWRGDITTLAADAIVNAANSQLLGCWVPGHYCIDNAIHTFSGVQLRMECAALMKAQGHEEPTGRAKVTNAYNLPAKHVIHTVGPIVEEGTQPDEQQRRLLAACYRSCLEAAADRGCKTIAFCCISTGVFGFPQEEAADIAIATVREWLDAHPGDFRVIFNVYLEEDERIYREKLSKLLGE